MARPSKFNDEVAEKILAAIRAGNFAEVAAVYAGISASTFYEWTRRGRAGEEPFAAFVEEVEQALASAEVRHVVNITEAAKKDWRASAWYLPRVCRDRWAERLPELPAGEVEVKVIWPEDQGVFAEPRDSEEPDADGHGLEVTGEEEKS